MTRTHLISSCAVAALFCAGSALAQTSGPQSSGSGIETVIVTGQRVPLEVIPLKSPFTASAITQETLLNLSPSPATTVQTLLNTQPSIYATTGGANGMETNVKFRSFAGSQFGETIAGVSLNDTFNGGVTYQADNRNNGLFVPRDLQGVEIYRGVNNPGVNTYNSMGGTINYVPRQPADTMGGDIGIDGGSFNTLNVHATFNTGDIDGLKQTISVERDYSSNWLDHTPNSNNHVYYANSYDLGHTQLFSYVVYNHNAGNAPQYIPVNLIQQYGQSYQWDPNTYASHNDDTNVLGIFGFKSVVNDWLNVEDEAFVGDNDYKRTSFSNPAYNGPYFLDDQGSGFPFWLFYGVPSLYDPTSLFASSQLGTDYHFYGYHGQIFGDRARATMDLPLNMVTVGADFSVGELHSREYWYGAYNMPQIQGYNNAWDEHDTRQTWSAFVQDDIHFWNDRVHITPGLKYISSASKDNDALGFFYFPPGSIHADQHFLSPTLGASVEAMENFTIYAAYGKNVKFPDITALYNELGYGGAVPPVTVKPEYAEDYEIGARYKLGTLQTSVNVYEENFSHIIYTAPIPGGFGASEQLNGGSQRYRGVEFQLVNDFGQVWVGNWKGYINASYNEAMCSTPTSPVSQGTADLGGSCVVGQSLANVPNYLLNGGLTWDWTGWHVDLTAQYVGQQQLQDYNTGQPVNPAAINPGQPLKIPGYTLVNIGVIKVIPLQWGPAQALRVGLHVDNLFDEHYYTSAQTNSNALAAGEDVYALTGAPRAVFASIGVYF